MRRRLVILTEIISPYRIPLFNELATHAEIDLHVIFLAETDPDLRQWRVYKEEIRFSYETLAGWRTHFGGYHVLLNRGVNRSLNAAAPDMILCGGYNYLASWQTLIWARLRSIPFLLWSESNVQDLRPGYALVEFLKDEFLHRCSGFIVPGQSAREYLRARKIKDAVIFTAPNAVDNGLFAAGAANARKNAETLKRDLNLPNRYFLFVGRLVAEKGVFELLSAYATLDEPLRQEVGLVFVGDGVARNALEKQAASVFPGLVKFVGFSQRESLTAYYALADVLVMPTHSDTWGLVVNEAMACGLPVIVSGAAGCVADLVRENWNGLLIPAKNTPALATALKQLVMKDDLRAMMGANSLQRISQYSSQSWSMGIIDAVERILPA